jgi:hypothetical protein
MIYVLYILAAVCTYLLCTEIFIEILIRRYPVVNGNMVVPRTWWFRALRAFFWPGGRCVIVRLALCLRYSKWRSGRFHE